jgi:hypothetical protein
MTDDIRPPTSEDPPKTGDQERLEKLPAFESDADRTAGGGVMDEGGTAVDKGTGQLGGTVPPANDDQQRLGQGGFPSLVDFGEDDERRDASDVPPAVGTDTD